MEENGLWDKTTVLVSTDHWFRFTNEPDQRVPFIIKLTGQKEASTFDPAFNTIISRNLLLTITKKEITTPQSLIKWLIKQSQKNSKPLMMKFN